MFAALQAGRGIQGRLQPSIPPARRFHNKQQTLWMHRGRCGVLRPRSDQQHADRRLGACRKEQIATIQVCGAAEHRHLGRIECLGRLLMVEHGRLRWVLRGSSFRPWRPAPSASAAGLGEPDAPGRIDRGRRGQRGRRFRAGPAGRLLHEHRRAAGTRLRTTRGRWVTLHTPDHDRVTPADRVSSPAMDSAPRSRCYTDPAPHRWHPCAVDDEEQVVAGRCHVAVWWRQHVDRSCRSPSDRAAHEPL
jgi:hypothetical protein